MNIFCIVLLKNTENRRNNEIYKSIGYSLGDLIRSNLYYVGIIALISVLIAVPSVLASYGSIMSMAVGMFGFREYLYEMNVCHLIMRILFYRESRFMMLCGACDMQIYCRTAQWRDKLYEPPGMWNPYLVYNCPMNLLLKNQLTGK